MDEFRVSSDPSELDFSVIYSFISTSYWAQGIPRETLQKAIDNSLCFGVYTQDNQQVGFARLVTDKATFAYLADVFIDQAYRGKGLSKRLIEAVTMHPEVQGLRRIVLATRDAHGLYQQFGFSPLDDPALFMQIVRPNIYQKHPEEHG
ncbi:N-acetylglutamate synthase, GNAT family [Vibrio xiamenensis]|uniref:N-acetylglutamate synthase, GNAT family n=1 Tax=Vibrio xiamenensis TaxID=861298 RepID=A0A1G8G9P9_9VIBR|nr:GNAT family N-acetyltransferase [Vibrio xiamenensis]SDH91099.1 N-acetylglutamate synthase, GNAT family [Vibrio xiamenensis]